MLLVCIFKELTFAVMLLRTLCSSDATQWCIFEQVLFILCFAKLLNIQFCVTNSAFFAKHYYYSTFPMLVSSVVFFFVPYSLRKLLSNMLLSTLINVNLKNKNIIIILKQFRNHWKMFKVFKKTHYLATCC